MADRSLAQHSAPQHSARSPRSARRNASYPLTIRGPSGDAVVEAMFRRAMTAPVGTNQHSDNVTTLKPERGNSRAYTLERLMRELPARQLPRPKGRGLPVNYLVLKGIEACPRAWA
jgi:hypothetical protein